MAIPLLNKIFGRKKDVPENQMPMPVTYYQPIPQMDRRPDADIINALTKNENIPDEVLKRHWCYDPKTVSLGKRSPFEAAILNLRFNRYMMEEENDNPIYKWDNDAGHELEKLKVSFDDAVHKSMDGFFLDRLTNPINITETRQAISTGQIQGEKKKGGVLSFIGLGD